MRIIITEEQKRMIDEAMESVVSLPSHILDSIKNGETALSDCPSISGYEKKLLERSYADVLSNFTDDITSYDGKTVLSKLSQLTTKCIKKEEHLRPQLEKLCINAIVEEFRVPKEGVDISCSLAPEISCHTQFHIKPDTDEGFQYEDVESMNNEASEVWKRKILNTFIVGGAMKISEKIMKSIMPDIFDLDEELPHLYSKIMKINEYLVFAGNFEITDKSHKQGGYVNVKLGDDITPTIIESQAIVLPMLVIETIRGCMELWVSHGLPDDVSAAEAVINKADALENDPWYMRYGTAIWESLYKFDNLDNISSFVSEMSELPCEDFFAMVKECVANTKRGESMLNDIMSRVKYNDEYSAFAYDIAKKQSERGIIEDGYFTDEELGDEY